MSVFIKGISLDEFADYDRDGIGYLIGTGQADEAPTPHGRLIDFDAFNDEATKLMDKFYEIGEYEEERGANMLRQIAIEQPTIIEAEEGEGE